jgi:stress-induced morphogen
MSTRQERMEALLQEAFHPQVLGLKNVSHTHQGHAGAGLESHYIIQIQADELASLTRVMAHRRVLDALAPEFEAGLHSVVIQLSRG